MKHLFLLLLSFSTLHAQVVINEYSAANYDDIDFQPGFGRNYADWIELYNTGASSVNLSGYFLSDRFSNPQKWQIPVGTTIAAGAHLLFLADQQDGFSSGNYHTNFKLTQTSGTEAVVLSNPAGNIVDSISLNYPNKKNESRCRMTDGSATWGISTNPTDGSSNNNSDDRYALTPIFSVAAGFYTASVTLTLTTTEPSSTIRYTLDGSDPNASSNLYSSPISINNTTVVRAKTYSSVSSIKSSHAQTNTYFINENHTTKVISIAGGTPLATLLSGTQIEPEGSLELFETDGTFLTESTGEFNKHGNDSWQYNQRGLDFVARDQFGQNYALQDEIFDNKNRDKFQRVILKCGASDNYPFEGQANDNYPGEFGGAHIRDAYINELSHLGDLRVDERTTEFAVMYVNGNYWGVYDIREKVDDHDFTKHYYDQDRYNIQYLKTWGPTWSEYGGAQAQSDWDALVLFITSNDMTIPANYAYVDSVFNTGSLIDYFILNGFVVNADWLNWNTSWWRGLDPAGDKKKWRYTLWDMDATFNHYTNYSGVPGQSATSDPCDPGTLPNLGGQGHVPIWNALKDNPDFFDDYANRYAELSSTVFSCDSMHNLLNSMVSEISGEMPAHITRWGGSLSEWQENVDSLHAFIDTRCANIITGLVGCDSALTGPYSLTLDVFPVGSGKVQLSSITPATYPFTSSYFGSVNISLNADPNQCWEFDYWTIANDTLFADSLTEMVTLTMSQDDTVAVYYKPTNCIYLDVQPPGAGSINIDGNLENSFPTLASVSDSVNHTFDAIANAGFSFNNWDWNIHNPLPSNTSSNTIVYTYTNDTLIVNFDQVISDTIVYVVQPIGAGTITVDAAVINSFPTEQIYSQSSNSSLVAIPNTGFAFNNWNMPNNTPIPNSTSSNITVTWASNDTVFVNFDTIPTFNVHFNVSPIGSGSMDIDVTNTNVTQTDINYFSGTNVALDANANLGFTFSHWQSQNNPLMPSLLNPSVNFNVASDDTISAIFEEFITDTLWVVSNPNGVSELHVGSDIITSTPFMGVYEMNAVLNINAIPSGTNIFNQWNLSGLSLPDYNANTFFTFFGQDTLFAYFNNILSIGDIGEDISSIKLYPTLVNDVFSVEILPNVNENIEIDLLNISGQKIQSLFSGSISKNQLYKEEFTVEGSNGIYLVNIKSSRTNTSYKIVKMQ